MKQSSMLAHYVSPQMRDKGLDGYWFQQDGAVRHATLQIKQFSFCIENSLDV